MTQHLLKNVFRDICFIFRSKCPLAVTFLKQQRYSQGSNLLAFSQSSFSEDHLFQLGVRVQPPSYIVPPSSEWHSPPFSPTNCGLQIFVLFLLLECKLHEGRCSSQYTFASPLESDEISSQSRQCYCWQNEPTQSLHLTVSRSHCTVNVQSKGNPMDVQNVCFLSSMKLYFRRIQYKLGVLLLRSFFDKVRSANSRIC